MEEKRVSKKERHETRENEFLRYKTDLACDQGFRKPSILQPGSPWIGGHKGQETSHPHY